MSTSVTNERLLVYTLAGVQFTHILDFMVLMPLGPQLIRVLHINAQQFALLVSAYVFVAAIASVIAASHVDRFDRRHVLIFVYSGFLLSTLLCSFANSFESLLAARALAGAFGGVAGSVVHSILGDVFPDQRRGAATGIVMSAFSIAAVLGVPAGLYFANHFDWRAPFLMVATLAVLVLLGVWKVVPTMRGHIRTDGKSRNAIRQLRAVFSEPNHRRAFAMMATLIFGGFSVIPFISPYMVANVGLQETDLPYLYFFGGMATAFTSRWFGRLSDRRGKREVFTVLALISILPLLIATNMPPWPVWLAVGATVVFFIFISGRFVPAMALLNSAALPGQRGSVLSLSSAIQQLASGCASLLAGFLIGQTASGELTHYWLVGLIAVGCTLTAIALAWRVKPLS
ncbi:MAG: MFS transporter [Burkholderiales bacterium]